jgi:hypothetical protein
LRKDHVKDDCIVEWLIADLVHKLAGKARAIFVGLSAKELNNRRPIRGGLYHREALTRLTPTGVLGVPIEQQSEEDVS